MGCENRNAKGFPLGMNQSIEESGNQKPIENLITHLLAQCKSSDQRIKILEKVIGNVVLPIDQQQFQKSLSEKSEEDTQTLHEEEYESDLDDIFLPEASTKNHFKDDVAGKIKFDESGKSEAMKIEDHYLNRKRKLSIEQIDHGVRGCNESNKITEEENYRIKSSEGNSSLRSMLPKDSFSMQQQRFLTISDNNNSVNSEDTSVSECNRQQDKNVNVNGDNCEHGATNSIDHKGRESPTFSLNNERHLIEFYVYCCERLYDAMFETLKSQEYIANFNKKISSFALSVVMVRSNKSRKLLHDCLGKFLESPDIESSEGDLVVQQHVKQKILYEAINNFGIYSNDKSLQYQTM